MSKVVYTSIDRIADLPTATWLPGDNSSYTETKRMAEKFHGRILLIGRLDNLGRVDLVRASAGRDSDGRISGVWYYINASNVAVAIFFASKLAAKKTGGDLHPWFDTIDDDAALKSACSLISRDCGTNDRDYSHDGDIHKCVSQITWILRAIGIPAGDWTYIPLMNAARSFETA